MQTASFRITCLSGVLLLLILLTAAFVEVTAHAQSYEDLPPELEERAQSLYASLLCPQCAGQTIAQSSAPVASAMRGVIRDQLLAGATDDAIVTALVSAYGEGVLASPPVRGVLAHGMARPAHRYPAWRYRRRVRGQKPAPGVAARCGDSHRNAGDRLLTRGAPPIRPRRPGAGRRRPSHGERA